MSDKIYKRRFSQTKKLLKGKRIEERTVSAVGSPIDERFNCPSCVPVGFSDDTYGVLWTMESKSVLKWETPEINEVVKHSRKMPRVHAGVGSGVIHIWAYPQQRGIKSAFIKYYYNDKRGRADFIVYYDMKGKMMVRESKGDTILLTMARAKS